jgi:FKBP-type peptidyl-prolyl cis-trans isomerase FklB
VIPGWTEALQLMKPGSRWQLVIPSNLAYGEAGRPRIPPHSTLVFEVELISIE